MPYYQTYDLILYEVTKLDNHIAWRDNGESYLKKYDVRGIEYDSELPLYDSNLEYYLGCWR